MTEISSLVPIIKEEIEKERQQTFEAAKEKDKDRTIVPDASLPDGPATWSILKPSPPRERPSLAARLKYCYRNELGDAELFQYLHRNQFVYDHSIEQWFEFNEIRWVRDKIQKTQRCVMEMAEIYESAEFIKADEAEVGNPHALRIGLGQRNHGKARLPLSRLRMGELGDEYWTSRIGWNGILADISHWKVKRHGTSP
jgi:hypothetical protein